MSDNMKSGTRNLSGEAGTAIPSAPAAEADLSVDLAGLPLACPLLTASGTCGYADEYSDFVDLRQIMQHDKKARAGRIRMVLPTRLGTVDLYDDVLADELAAAVECLGG